MPVPRQESERSCICVLGVSRQESERSCICVLGVSRQESGRSCICVLGVSRQENERSCICVLGVSMLPLTMTFLLDCSDSVLFIVSCFSFYYGHYADAYIDFFDVHVYIYII